MLHDLPAFISIVFILTTIATLLLFYWTVKNSSAETVRKRSSTIPGSIGNMADNTGSVSN
jgi:lipoprotein signal peptidase